MLTFARRDKSSESNISSHKIIADTFRHHTYDPRLHDASRVLAARLSSSSLRSGHDLSCML